MFGSWPGRFVITAIIGALAGGIFFFTQPSAPSQGTANVWVNTSAGGSPSRCFPACAYNSANAYGNFQTAYAAANPGDLILVQPSANYPPQTIVKGIQNQNGPVITFKCAVVDSCDVKDGNIVLGANNGNTNGTAPNHIAFDDINIDNGHMVIQYAGVLGCASGSPSCSISCSASAPQCYASPLPVDFTWKNGDIYCTKYVGSVSCGGHLMNFLGVDGAVVQNAKLGPGCCDGDAFQLTPRGCTTYNNGANSVCALSSRNVLSDHVDVHDITDSCTHMRAVMLAIYGCTGFSYGDLGVGNQTTLAQPLGALTTDTTLVVTDSTLFPSTGYVPFNARITSTGGFEIVKVTNISGTTWTVVRNVSPGNCGSGGVLMAHAQGDVIALCDQGYDHVDGYQISGINGSPSDYLTIQNGSILAMNPGSAVSQAIFFGTANCAIPCYQGNITISNMMIGSGGTCGICVSAGTVPADAATWKVLNNTLAHSIRIDGVSLAPGTPKPQLIGNIASAFNNTGSGPSCTWTYNGGSTQVASTADWNHNAIGKVCDPTDLNISSSSVTFVQPNAGANLIQDLHLTSGVQAVVNAGGANPPTSNDYDGDPRPGPDGLANIGADETVISLANMWVVPNGGSSTCTRSASLIDYATANTTNHVCDTFNRAYQASAAAGGDMVRVPCGVYTDVNGQAFTPNTSKTGLTTFEPDTPYCVTIDPTAGGTSASGASAIVFNDTSNGCVVCGSFSQGTKWIKIKNFNLISYNSAVRDGSSNAGNASTQHIIIDSNKINVGVKCWCSNTINVSSAAQDWQITNNTIGPQCCGSHNAALNQTASPVGVNIGKATVAGPVNDCTTTACNIKVDNNFFQFASTRLCSEWPSSGFGQCPDVDCANFTYCHYDGIHFWGCITCEFNFNKFYGQACQGIFAENGVNGGIGKDIDMIGNISSAISSLCNGFLSLKMNTAAAGTWNICYNEAPNSIAPIYGLSTLAPPSGTVINLCGNYTGMFEQTQSPNCTVLPCGSPPPGCTLLGGGGGTYTCAPVGAACGVGAVNITIVHKYNASRTQGPCDSTDVVGTTPSWINSLAGPAVGQDMHKTGANGVADNLVNCSAVPVPCPALDWDGQVRPQNTNADAGADDRNQ